MSAFSLSDSCSIGTRFDISPTYSALPVWRSISSARSFEEMPKYILSRAADIGQVDVVTVFKGADEAIEQRGIAGIGMGLKGHYDPSSGCISLTAPRVLTFHSGDGHSPRSLGALERGCSPFGETLRGSRLGLRPFRSIVCHLAMAATAATVFENIVDSRIEMDVHDGFSRWMMSNSGKPV